MYLYEEETHKNYFPTETCFSISSGAKYVCILFGSCIPMRSLASLSQPRNITLLCK